MRAVSLLLLLTIWRTVCVVTIHDALPTATAQSLIAATAVPPSKIQFLDKRQQQGSCQANHISCESISAPEACCPNGTTCARDGAGKIACCPNNYVCTGTLGGAGGGSSTSQTSSSGGASGGSTTSMPSSSGITPAPNSGSGITVGSTLANPYYPFPIITTAYPNAGACLSAFTFCQQQSSSCYAVLAGQNGVTISNGLGGGGVTQTGASGIPQASASQICSSLSMTACYGIQSGVCSQFGGAGGTGSVSQGHGPRETGHPDMRYMAAMGMVGAIGLVL